MHHRTFSLLQERSCHVPASALSDCLDLSFADSVDRYFHFHWYLCFEYELLGVLEKLDIVIGTEILLNLSLNFFADGW